MQPLDDKRAIVIFIAALLAALVLSFAFPQKVVDDAAGYDKLGWNLAEGNGFTYSTKAPYEPTASREPVYPLFVSAVYRVFGHHHEAVLVFQAFLHAITSVLIYIIAKNWFSLKVSLIAGILVAADPTLAGFCAYLATEPLALFLLALFIFMMLRLSKEHGLIFAAAGGSLLATLTLTRAVFLLFPLFVFAAMLFDKRTGWKRNLLHGFVLIFVFAAVLSPWLYRNKKLFGVAFITTRSGHTLLWRAMRTEYTPKEMLMHAVYGASDTLGKKLYPEDYGRLTVRGEIGPDNIYMTGDRYYLDLRAKGFSELEADREMRREAYRLIERRPFVYAAQSFLELWKMSFFEIVPFAYSERFEGWMSVSEEANRIGTAVRVMLRYVYSWCVLIFAFIGFFKVRKHIEQKFVLLLPVAYTVLTAVLVDSGSRYLFPAVPFIMILAAACLVPLSSALGHGYERQPQWGS